MPTQKRGHEDADDNHVKASENIPRPKKLRKRPVEKSSDEQKEPLDDPWLKKCQASDIPRPKKLRKNPREKSSAEQKESLDDPRLEKCQASEDIPRPKMLRKNPIEKSNDEQKEPLDDLRLAKCQASEDIPRPKMLRKNPIEKSSDEQKGPLDDLRLAKCHASEDIPRPKMLRKKPVEKSSDEQKEPFDDPIAETLCQPARFVPAKQTENLSKLPYELLVEIAMRLKKLEDFTCFRSVSRSFHLNVKEEYFEGLPFRKSLPYFMLPPISSRDGNDDIRRQFYSLVEGESIVASLEIPAFKTSTKMCFESLGWLLTVEVDGSMSLLDPFSNIEIPLPRMYTYRTELMTYDMRSSITKMVLSSRPNENKDFIMMVITGDCYHLAFWRLGDKSWNWIDDQRRGNCDVLYVGGEQFYVISAMGIIWSINLAAGHVELRNIMNCIHILHVNNCQGQYILKSINGTLLGITRSRDQKFFLTSEFRVYDIDIKTGESREIYSLGSMAIFLGRNSSFAVDATANASNGGVVIKANHIYFTDDFGEYQRYYFEEGDQWRSFTPRGSRYAKGGSVDCGVFNFETGEIEPIYPVMPLLSNVCPAMWITPNLSKLPYEVLVEITMRLKTLEDFTCFKSVSRSFHLNVKEEYFEGLCFRKSLPYLMLPSVSSSSDGNERQFYSLVEGESIVASLEVPAFKTSTKMCFESLGWLMTVEVDGSMSLLDPFSDTEIPLPHMYTFPGTEQIAYDKRFLIKKMALSSRPNETTNFILMIIIGEFSHLAFWRLGDKAWNKIDVEDKAWNKIDVQKPCLNDVVYVGGEKFYAVSRGIIWAVDLAARHVELCNIVSCLGILRIDHTQGQYILKSINGSLLGVKRSRDKKFFLTSEFRVYDIDTMSGLKREIYSLGNMAIFLGRNSSFAVDATDTASNEGGVIKANHIYFTDDLGEYQRIYFEEGDQWRSFSGGSRYARGGSVDSGVFNFETGDIEAIYPVKPLMRNVCPAMWITPNL